MGVFGFFMLVFIFKGGCKIAYFNKNDPPTVPPTVSPTQKNGYLNAVNIYLINVNNYLHLRA